LADRRVRGAITRQLCLKGYGPTVRALFNGIEAACLRSFLSVTTSSLSTARRRAARMASCTRREKMVPLRGFALGLARANERRR
jgi:hypothetical protein